MKVNNAIVNSKKVLMQYWPLNSFIATNPLFGFSAERFYDVVSNPCFAGLMNIDYYLEQYKNNKISKDNLKKAIKLVDNKELGESELEQWIVGSTSEPNRYELFPLLAQQCDEYKFQNPTVWIKEKIFKLLRDFFGLKQYKKIELISFWKKNYHIRQSELKVIEENSAANSVNWFLSKLTIPDNLWQEYLQAIYLQVYGWASFMNWRNDRPDNPWHPGETPCEIILLMWLYYEYIIASEQSKTYQKEEAYRSLGKNSDSFKQRYIWQTAFELNYLNSLENSLNKNIIQKKKTPDAQFLFCIDTRSEGLRRQIEETGNYQTFGFAGFFGAIFSLQDKDNISYQAPALVKPSVCLTEMSQQSRSTVYAMKIKNVIAFTKRQLTSPFALFEMLGFWFAFFMLYKALQPKLKLKNHTASHLINNTLNYDDQFQAAVTLLKSIGLIDNFSRWVIICAHQTDNINNPFKSSLNCGACGGNSGIPNAMIMCEILNSQIIRSRLKSAGIVIPATTRFIAACHHTGYDRVEIIKGEIPQQVHNALAQAADKLRVEKIKNLPGHNKLSQREKCWSELIPELGLINNTAIIVGPRALTLNQDLQRRVFLHSYQPELDQDANILTSIFSAPVIVAHWINAQYYFSTVNPELFGAGNKAIHNVLPDIGVLEGNLSDLKIGLPLQSIHFQALTIHEPRRLIVIVYAAKATLDLAIKNAPLFKQLLDNNWIYLKHIEVK